MTGRATREIRCQFIILARKGKSGVKREIQREIRCQLREIRCQFIILARTVDMPTILIEGSISMHVPGL